MAYTPTTWSTGDTITASALNKMEQGIADGGGGAVIITDNGSALDKTFAEIYDLVKSGTPCYIKHNVNAAISGLDSEYAYTVRLFPVTLVYKYDDAYRVMASSVDPVVVSNTSALGMAGAWIYQVSTSSGYPTFHYRVYVNNSYLTKSNGRQ